MHRRGNRLRCCRRDLNGAPDLNHLGRPRGGFVFRNIGIGIRRITLGDRGDGTFARGFFEILGQQIAHDGVARTAAATSQHHADQMAVAAAHRGHEIEA